MPRKARIVVPNTPYHVVQRGHNKQEVFVNDDDFHCYLENLFEWKTKFDCKVYAWCLMTNHIHLVIEPGEDVESLGNLIKIPEQHMERYQRWIESDVSEKRGFYGM